MNKREILFLFRLFLSSSCWNNAKHKREKGFFEYIINCHFPFQFVPESSFLCVQLEFIVFAGVYVRCTHGKLFYLNNNEFDLRQNIPVGNTLFTCFFYLLLFFTSGKMIGEKFFFARISLQAIHQSIIKT